MGVGAVQCRGGSVLNIFVYSPCCVLRCTKFNLLCISTFDDSCVQTRRDTRHIVALSS